jgi:hypothetical protein
MSGCGKRDKEDRLVSRRDKLLAKMRNSPTGIRFAEVVFLLRQEGFVLFIEGEAIARFTVRMDDC